MSSRRRNSKKNLGTNLSDIQRRLRRMERKPIRTRLQNRVIKASAIAPSSITADEVEFGTAVVSSDPANEVLNPKDGLLVINPDTGAGQLYNAQDGEYVPLKDTVAQASADGKNTIYYSATQPTGATFATDDTWFDTDDGYKIYTWTGSAWSGFELGNNAIAAISATKITAGSLAAGVIVTSAIDAGQISAGTINAAISMTAATITGGTIQQGSSGNYILMDQTNKATIKFNVTGFANPGFISVESAYSGTLGWLSLQAPTTGSENDVASIDLTPENMYLSAGYIDISSAGNFSLGNADIGIQLKYGITKTPAGYAPDAGLNRFIKSVRNIWQSPNSYTPSGGDGDEGDVWLTY